MLNIEEDNSLAPIDDLDLDEDQKEIGYVDVDYKNQNDTDLGFIHEEQFHACGIFKDYDDEFPPYKNDPRPCKRGDGGVSSRDTSIDTQRSTNSTFSFITSWKHSVKVKLNLKVLKYLSLSPPAEMSPVNNQIPTSKPYYEYFINSLFSHWNLNKSCLRYLEVLSIFLLRRLDRLNSQFKLVHTFIKSD